MCKRYGSDNGNRNWSAGPWKVGCSFAISLKALHTEKKMSENPKDPQKGSMPKCRPVWEREVLIKDANVVHGGGCKPGEERIAVVKKPPKAVHPNVSVMKNGGLVNLFTKIRGKSAFIKVQNAIISLIECPNNVVSISKMKTRVLLNLFNTANVSCAFSSKKLRQLYLLSL